MSRNDRKYDVIVWGATGFTGAIVAQYLAGATQRKSQHNLPPLKWALGGRNLTKLEALKSSLQVDKTIAREPEIVVADVDDASSMKNMTSQTRVVISTVGPFLHFGESLISACCQTGTDYCDTAGEGSWNAKMGERYQKKAEETGAVLVSMCGFDSLPSDLAAFLAASELKNKYKTNTMHVQGYVNISTPLISGGTVVSVAAGLDSPDEHLNTAFSPYLLNPPSQIPAKKRMEESDQWLPKYDNITEQWTAPCMLSMVNTRVVRRSFALRRELDQQRKFGNGHFGPETSFNESMVCSNVGDALFKWVTILFGLMVMFFRPTRYLLQKFVLPAVGEGPTVEERAATKFALRCIGQGENGKRVSATISGGEPGYNETSKMVSETALMLAFDRERKELEMNTLVDVKSLPSTSHGRVGGFFTPSLAGGMRLVERLKNAGMGVVVEEFMPRRKGVSWQQ